MRSGLYVNITDYLINFVFYLKINKPINVALVLLPVQDLLEATKYSDFIEADLQKFSLCRGKRSSIYQEYLKKYVFSIMSFQEFTES